MGTKVVVTGMGVVSPVGNTVSAFWESLCAGRSGVHAITHFETADLPTRFGGVVDEVVPEGMTPKDLRRADLYTVYAIEAANQAWRQSGLDISAENPYRCGVLVGSGIGGIETIHAEGIQFHLHGPKRISPLMVPKGLANMASGVIAIRLGLQGPNKAVVTACATGTHCIGDAAALIRAGKADIMLAGGAEAALNRFGIAGFGAMRAISRRNDAPERASRPFDKDRDGFVLADGAGVLVLESEMHARRRGAAILGEIAGMGETCDAFHITAPREDGTGAAEAMRLALAEAQMNPGDIGYYNAHGTSTQHNDPMECRALYAVFGDTMPPASSTKSMTGHLLGAAGAIEAIACLLAIRDGVLPPSINYDTPDPECPLNLVANEARETRVAFAMSNSLGFGGHNASIIVKNYG
ncbi:MAG: beta-ketoacyl-ACP synthase II [Candidatus Hydrogenedentes bacterium]|nr:beta-ketoacyl-ACP synthase II [Candidatus Hydrogenedentota bacterium]